MEELNILEADAAERRIQLRTIAEIFCVLLLVVLLSDSTFTRSADHFLDLLLVPVFESGNAAYEKNSGNMPDIETTAKNVLKELDLKNPVIPCSDETCLLMEVATTNQSLLLEESFNQDANRIEDDKNFAILASADESSMLEPVTGNPSTVLEESESNAIELMILDDTQPAPLPEPTPSEITVSDSKLQDPTQISAAESTLQEPVMQAPLPDQPQSPKENVADTLTSEEASMVPLTPELTEPGLTESDFTQSDVIDPSDIETDTEDDAAAETLSCFLMDETGVLFGFVPQYADIEDGCLVLPEECTGIRSGTFSGVGAGITELYIPAGATMIEYGAFIGLDSLIWIEVQSPNPMYTSINGILFDSTTTVLITFPAGRTDAYSLPEHVMQIASGAFTDTSLSRLDFRRCSSLFLEENIFGPSTGNGIVIAVPSESFPVYEDILSTYAVTLTI